ncbi:hypothetical protein G6732_08890 [Polynucleobacter paneuropaeus]|jgi:hypothetical protein|nr:hypothetical protein [Polynucleobacter paneuropaeus]
MKQLMCEYSDEEVAGTTHMFIEYMSFSTGCQLSKNTIYQLKDAKIWIDTVLNNQMMFDDDF